MSKGSTKVPFNVMSDKRCGCGRPLKANVVTRRPAADRCYTCARAEEADRGHTISTANEVRTGKRPHRTHGPYTIGSKGGKG